MFEIEKMFARISVCIFRFFKYQRLLLFLVLNKQLLKRRIFYSLVMSVAVATLFSTSNASALGPDDPSCYEKGDCPFFQEPFDTMIIPFSVTFGDFTFVVIWGLIIGIIWLRTSHTMLTAVVGISLAVLFTEGGGFSDDAKTIGYSLVAFATAILLYQLLVVRLSFPTN